MSNTGATNIASIFLLLLLRNSTVKWLYTVLFLCKFQSSCDHVTLQPLVTAMTWVTHCSITWRFCKSPVSLEREKSSTPAAVNRTALTFLRMRVFRHKVCLPVNIYFSVCLHVLVYILTYVWLIFYIFPAVFVLRSFLSALGYLCLFLCGILSIWDYRLNTAQFHWWVCLGVTLYSNEHIWLTALKIPG